MTVCRQNPVVLTIAGSDSSGGAGIQADLKTFGAFGVYGTSAITALTAQSPKAVYGVLPVPPAFIAAQIDAVAGDLDVRAVKTGMLGDQPTVDAVANAIERHRLAPLVVDPVMVATSGAALIPADAVAAVRARLIPLADVITPNLPEAARLLDTTIARSQQECRDQAQALLQLGCRAVLLKGGHGDGAEAVDWLVTPSAVIALSLPRIAGVGTHGTGCTLSAALVSLLALGTSLPEAARRAKLYVWRAMQAAAASAAGRGHPPGGLDHHFAVRDAEPPA